MSTALHLIYRYRAMHYNLTVPAKSGTRISTRTNSKTGRRTALDSGFFMSAARLYLPVMVGRVELPSGRSAFRFWADSANSARLATQLSKLALRRGGSEKSKRRLTMAQLRQNPSNCLSIHGQRVHETIQFNLPKFGESPRILLDPNEISTLSRISIDNVVRGVKELERKGYIARMFKGRRSKAHVYALLNPELKGTAMEAWA